MFRLTNLIAFALTALGLSPVLVKADSPREGASGMAVLGFTQLSNEESWNRLPVEKGTGEPLPSWARSLAGPMPRLTASLLRLCFPPEEQRAFAFARTLTRAPWTVTAEDIRGLERDFGSERALAVIYNSCWGNYMTRVSNGFQLRLERDNIFFDGFSRETVPAGRTTATPSNNLAKPRY